MKASNGNANPAPGHKVPLDWTRLLGFDQASRVVTSAAPRARLARVGVKVGLKPATPA